MRQSGFEYNDNMNYIQKAQSDQLYSRYQHPQKYVIVAQRGNVYLSPQDSQTRFLSQSIGMNLTDNLEQKIGRDNTLIIDPSLSKVNAYTQKRTFSMMKIVKCGCVSKTQSKLNSIQYLILISSKRNFIKDKISIRRINKIKENMNFKQELMKCIPLILQKKIRIVNQLVLFLQANIINKWKPRKVRIYRNIQTKNQFKKHKEKDNQVRIKKCKQNVMERNQQRIENILVNRSRAGLMCTRQPKINQDSYTIDQINNCKIYMVLDGHGPNGHIVSNHTQSIILKYLKEELKLYKQPLNNTFVSNLMYNIYRKTDQYLMQSGIEIYNSGTTIVVLLMQNTNIWCVNLGDSRAILISGYDKQEYLFELSQDHKPDLPEEQKRIESCGGRVAPIYNQLGIQISPARLWAQNQEYPGLAMSRCFGDMSGRPLGLICTPEIIQHKLNTQDRYIVIASDGIWQWMSNEDVSNHILNNTNRHVNEMVEQLISQAQKEWLNRTDIIDDITCIVLKIQRFN